MMGSWGLWGGWMIIVWVFVAGLVVWGIIALARHDGPRPGDGDRRSPLDIAKERYAKGELSKDEYEQIKRDL